MSPSIRETAKRTPLRALMRWVRRRRARHLPSPQEKHAIIRTYAAEHGCSTLVETGTNEGGTVFACLGSFKHIYSIELATGLYERALVRFAAEQHVHLYHGDSATVLPSLLETIIREPSLFWLDGHYCGGETGRAPKDPPIEAELDAILTHGVRSHVILIDDARVFGSRAGYPTVPQVRSLILSRRPQSLFSVERDIIRIVLR